MTDTKEYVNTIEHIAEKYYNKWKIWTGRSDSDWYPNWCDMNESSKEPFKFGVITVLDAVNYFKSKTCKDCDFFERAPCITPEGDYSEDPDKRICTNFVPKGMTGAQKGC